jgi:hypothetical protein
MEQPFGCVINPILLEIPCGTVEQMKLFNTSCWLYEYTKKIGQKDRILK